MKKIYDIIEELKNKDKDELALIKLATQIKISNELESIHDVIYDTNGSAKMGDALDAIKNLPFALNDLTSLLNYEGGILVQIKAPIKVKEE